jgi:hypothetical protein
MALTVHPEAVSSPTHQRLVVTQNHRCLERGTRQSHQLPRVASNPTPRVPCLVEAVTASLLARAGGTTPPCPLTAGP